MSRIPGEDARGGEPGDAPRIENSVANVEAFQRLALTAFRSALIADGSAGGFTLVEARVIRGTTSERKKPDAVTTRGEAVNSPSARLAVLAQLDSGAPGAAKGTVHKDIQFDGEVARVEVVFQQDKPTLGDGPIIDFWLNFYRTFPGEAGSRLLRQTLNGGMRGLGHHLGQIIDLLQVGYSNNRFNGRVLPLKIEQWLPELTARFGSGVVALGSLAFDAWRSLVEDPLSAAHILRNRGDSSAMARLATGGHRWSGEADVGTEEGEMTVSDVLDLAQYTIEDAQPITSEPSADIFTLTEASVDTVDGGAAAIQYLRTNRPIVTVGGRSATVEEASATYRDLLRVAVKSGTVKTWRGTAEKALVTREGVVRLEVASHHHGDSRRAEIRLWRSLADPSIVVEHRLMVSQSTYRGVPVATFDNTHRIMRRKPDATGRGDFIESTVLPVEWQDIVREHPDVAASLTYDVWYGLIKRPLIAADVVT